MLGEERLDNHHLSMINHQFLFALPYNPRMTESHDNPPASGARPEELDVHRQRIDAIDHQLVELLHYPGSFASGGRP